MSRQSGATKASATNQLVNPWGSSLDKFKEWDPQGAELLLRVGANPWKAFDTKLATPVGRTLENHRIFDHVRTNLRLGWANKVCNVCVIHATIVIHFASANPTVVSSFLVIRKNPSVVVRVHFVSQHNLLVIVQAKRGHRLHLGLT